MNRCIQCYRCVRFYRDYAGGTDFDAFAAHNHVYFGRHEDGTLENEFSGNLIEVCPTGVFTDKTLKKHYTRKWDLTNAPSICQHCGLGCNIIASERYGGVRRILSRYNGEVNGYFICDRGRFGYEFANSNKRIKTPLLKSKSTGQFETIDKDTAVASAGKIISQSEKIIGIGSPRASLESNWMLKKMVGNENFYLGISDTENKLISEIINILQNGIARTPSLREVEKSDAVLILGEDLTNTAPMLALALRQSAKQKPLEQVAKLKIPDWQDAAVRELIQNDKSPIYIATPAGTKLDDIVGKTLRAAPNDIARFGFAVASLLNNEAPQVSGMTDEIKNLAEKVAGDLKSAKNPLVIAGTSCMNESIIHAAANTAWALCKKDKKCGLTYTVPEANSIGLSMIGGKKLSEAFRVVENEVTDSVFILENDLFRRDSKEKIEKFLINVENVISLDYLRNETIQNASLVIPVGSFAESDGTMINNEGRAQRYYQVYDPGSKDMQESWRYVQDIMDAAGSGEDTHMSNFAEFTISMVKDLPAFEGIEEIAPPPDFREAGQKIPRSPHRYSGRTAMHANINVSEPKPPEDPDSALSFTMEGYRGMPPSSVIPFFWAPGWNSAQSINKYQIEVGGSLHGGDPGKRLIEPNPKSEIKFFNDIPETFKPGNDEWLFVPMYQIFGSEELSMSSPPVAERAAKPSVSLNPDDAGKLRLKKDDEVEFTLDGNKYKLPVKIKTRLPKGIAGLPVGLKEVPFVQLPKTSKINGADK